MNTSKRVIKVEMKQENRHLEVEIKKLEDKNQELRDENRKLHNFLNVIL